MFQDISGSGCINFGRTPKPRFFTEDTGGQYKDGTTDVTRTVHFGCPTQVGMMLVVDDADCKVKRLVNIFVR